MPTGFVVRVTWGQRESYSTYDARYFCKTMDETLKKIREKLDEIIEDYQRNDKQVFFFNYEIEPNVSY